MIYTMKNHSVMGYSLNSSLPATLGEITHVLRMTEDRCTLQNAKITEPLINELAQETEMVYLKQLANLS